MKRILLVDDDTIVRLYLSDVVNWEEHGMEVVGAARNGEEALELVQLYNPDIVLTDICMPKMDGIDLIHRLRKEGYDGVIYVLSCHDEFDMVKNAMQEGADDYLLKNNLNDRSINSIVRKIKNQLDQRQRKSAQMNTLQSLASKGMKAMRRELLEGIANGSLTGTMLQEQMNNAGMQGRFRRLIMVSIRPLGADKEQLDSLLRLCEQRLGQEQAEVLCLGDDALAMLIDLSDEPSEKAAAELCNRLQTVIQRLAEQYLNLQVAMGASAVCEGKDALAVSLKQASLMQENNFYGAGRWRYGIDLRTDSQLPEEAHRFLNELVELLSDADDTTIQRLYTEALKAIKKARVKKETVISWLKECDQMVLLQRTEEYYKKIVFWENLAECADDYIELRNQKQSRRVPETAGPTIRRAVKYIYDHFDEPITQTLVSRHVNLTSTYFSTLFKQEMGVGFSEFVTTIRLEWICNRLTNTSLTIKQISEDAGFPDYPYFCKTFKKMYGISPAEYRKGNMKQG